MGETQARTVDGFLVARTIDDAVAAEMARGSVPLVHRDDRAGEAYIERFGVERTLREIEAKRRAVAHARAFRAAAEALPDGITRDASIKMAETAEDAVRYLAAVYSDHPDYRPEWKP